METVRHTDACCCVRCESVKLRTVDVEAWRALHQYHGDFVGVFSEVPFPHEREDWHWLICECGSRVLMGEHPLQKRQSPTRKRTALSSG